MIHVVMTVMTHTLIHHLRQSSYQTQDTESLSESESNCIPCIQSEPGLLAISSILVSTCVKKCLLNLTANDVALAREK